ncbi:uncharacterized protein LOC131931197 [Physella acuta]|uniref:uncharacterized protein LOC131931197 n=1 Tax=Physella acuta TaxID=109671 RepID=UPI0027DCF9C5|nr:uncharacterized protein LOC131931197 [Physella acuta]
MSTLHNGLHPEPIINQNHIHLKDTTTMNQMDKSTSNSSISECDSGHSSNVKSPAQNESNTDEDPTASDFSPDISLSSQKTLRYSDVESELNGKSGLSSDSMENFEGLTKLDKPVDMYGKSSVQHTNSCNENSSTITPDSADADLSVNAGASGDAVPEISNALRPESLSLPWPLQTSKQEKRKINHIVYENDSKNSFDSSDEEMDGQHVEPSQGGSSPIDIKASDDRLVEPGGSLSNSLPQGTITRKGDMIQFVADDLHEKIKQSSPMSYVADTVSTDSRRSSVRSVTSFSSSTSFATSSGVSRSPSSQFQQSPDDIPPIDAAAVIELENHARRVADNLDLMMGNIRNNLHKMSALTIGCQDAYKRSVDITCDSVDASIKSMYALMAKCEELSMAMGPVEQLAVQIKEIKRILDLFETQLMDK